MRDLEKDKKMIEDFIFMLGSSNYCEPIALHAIERAVIAESKVEEMQKTLEWYADESNWWMDAVGFVDLSVAEKDSGERARQALKGVIK